MKKLLSFPLVLLACVAFAQVKNPLLSPPTGVNGVSAQAAPITPIKPSDLRSSMFPQGMAFIGGRANLSLGSEKVKNNNTTTKIPTMDFGVGPHAGFYFMDNVAIGGGVSYDYSSRKTPGSQGSPDLKTTSSNMGINVFGRYANTCDGLFDCCHTLGYYVDLGVGLSAGKTTDEDYDGEEVTTTKNKTSSIHAGITPGILWFPTPRVGLEASLGSVLSLSTSKSKPDNPDFYNQETTSTNFEVFNLNTMGLSLGVNYYLMAGK